MLIKYENISKRECSCCKKETITMNMGDDHEWFDVCHECLIKALYFLIKYEFNHKDLVKMAREDCKNA